MSTLSAVPVFAALGDATRFGLVVSLGDSGPSTAARLASGMTISRQAVGKQLAILESAGIVTGVRRGRERIWAVNAAALAAAGQQLADSAAKWDAAIERLRAFVEVEPN